MIRSIRAALLAGVVAGAVAIAAPAPAETLAEAIAAAYDRNPELLAARADTRVADAVVAQTRSAYGPNLNVAAAGIYTDSRVQLDPEITLRQKGVAPSYDLTASQVLFTSGRLSARVRAAQAGVGLAREQLRQTEQQVLTDVITAYVAVRRDQQLVAISRDNLALLERQNGDVSERARMREATMTDREQTANRLALARGQLAEAEGQLAASRSAYAAAVGHPPGDLAPEPALIGLPATLEAAYAAAEENNPTLAGARFRELQSRALAHAAAAERGPSVSAEGAVTRNSTSPYNNQLRTDQVLGRVVLNMPIYSGGQISARMRETREANERDWRLLDQARRDVRDLVARMWTLLNTTRIALPSYRQAVDAAGRAFSGAREQERLGDRTTLDVLDQARDLLQSRTAFVQAEASEYRYAAALLAAMGRLQAPLIVPGAVTPVDPLRRAGRRGGVPGVTDGLLALDNAVDGNLKAPRASRDPAIPVHDLPAAAPASNATGAYPSTGGGTGTTTPQD